MTSTNAPKSSGWTAGAPYETTITSQPGQVLRGYVVPFTTGQGVTGSVEVPMARIGDVDYVRALIAAEAAKLDAVNNLSSGS